MGIKRNENSGGGAVFLRINAKEGCIQHNELGADGKPVKGADNKNIVIKEPPFTQIEGTVVGISFEEDEFEGAKNFKVRLAMQDVEPNQPKMYVDFAFGTEAKGASFFGLALMGKLNASDLTKPITLMPWHMAKGAGNPPLTADKTGVTLIQGGQKIKEDFGNGMTSLPDRPVVKVGAQEVKDNSSWDEIAQNLYAALEAKLTPGQGEVGAPADNELDPAEVAAAAQQAGNTARPSFKA